MKTSSMLRLLMAVFFVVCGFAAAGFALMFYGATLRTPLLGIAAVAAGLLIAAAADGVVVALLRGDGEQIGRAYLKIGQALAVLGALLGVSILVWLGQILPPVIKGMFQ